ALQSLAEAYLASVVMEETGARVNLLFSTDTPWLRVRSEIPRAGRLRLEVLQEERVSVRLPDWVPPETVQVDRAGSPGKTRRRGNTLDLGPLTKGAKVTVSFDQPRRKTRERAPGFPDPFEVEWRGDTIVAMEPRPAQPIALY
ncbi:MAG: hypothetical protein OXG96_15225, partial [Acidobacteria bacterium]|nr:hypothetical protein [Acidobacteriota bacterium]